MENYPKLEDLGYRIEGEIGSGGGGVVYKAWHTRLNQHVVIKELKRGADRDIETQRNEVEALKNVKSEFLPQVFDFITVGKRVFTVIEFIEGESLDKLLHRGQEFTRQQVVKWYEQLSSALESIHKQNMNHRDIKPANIMLKPNGDVCLIDFNAALVSGNDVRLISRSLGYASPEQYEIYERFKGAIGAPINFGTSNTGANTGANAGAKSQSGTETEALDENDLTELEDVDSQRTELLKEDADSQQTEFLNPSASGDIDWARSDIYSLGSTMYHLLSGTYPPERAEEVIPVSKLGKFSEGIVYIIEQSMKLDPSERFASSTVLSDAVRNIHRHDTRWKISQTKRLVALIVLPVAFVIFLITMIGGVNVMAQEQEERFYSAVYQIINGDDPGGAFDMALDMFWDRIDPYYAMAQRLWNDGEIEAARAFIEGNLGYIAQFQSVPEAATRFGNIYFILGNCYLYLSGEPNYHMARGYFEIAVQFVTDNPIVFRDYAIALARTGDVESAYIVLEQAIAIGLDSDSVGFLRGEISFVLREFESALERFSRVIMITDDDFMRYRAIIVSDDIFRDIGQPEYSIELLSENLNRVPHSRVPMLTERLADAYFRNGDHHAAIVLFEELAEMSPPRFHIMEGLAILLHTVGDYDRAAVVLGEMLDLFPNDYRVPMRLAFLEAGMQSVLENELRDYGLALQYYEQAVELYYDSLRAGQGDAEMQQLSLIIEQLSDGGWFD